MEKESFFEKLRNQNRGKYIQEHGRKKFLLEQTKSYNICMFMAVGILTMGSSAILIGFWLLNIIFSVGILFFILSGISIFAALLLAIQLPRIKREAKQAEEELLNMKQEINKKESE